jgi:hypothetical protein
MFALHFYCSRLQRNTQPYLWMHSIHWKQVNLLLNLLLNLLSNLWRAPVFQAGVVELDSVAVGSGSSNRAAVVVGVTPFQR